MAACIANPVSYENECRRGDDGVFRAKVKDVDDDGGDEAECEEEGGAQPVDCCVGRVEVYSCMVRNGGEGEPLSAC